MGSERMKSCKEQFFNWLTSSVTSYQLSEIYQAFLSIDEYCLSRGFLKHPVFETYDETILKKIRQRLEADRFFRKHCRVALAQSALTKYMRFLQEQRPGSAPEAIAPIRATPQEQMELAAPVQATENQEARSTGGTNARAVPAQPSLQRAEPIDAMPKAAADAESAGETRGANSAGEQGANPSIDRQAVKKRAFDLREAVILLDAYLSMKAQGTSLATTASDVSRRLRALAWSRGMEIDESYRSVVGVQAQLSIMGSIIEGKTPSPNHRVPIFYEAAELCRNNPSRFREILLGREERGLPSPLPAVSSPVPPDAQAQNRAESSRPKKVNFLQTESYAYTAPEILLCFHRCHAVKSWADAYIKFLGCVYRQTPEKIEALKGGTVHGGRRLLWGDVRQSSSMAAPKEIENSGIYAETNFSADNTVKLIRAVMKRFGMDPEKVSIYYHPLQRVSASIKAVAEGQIVMPGVVQPRETKPEPSAAKLAPGCRERYAQVLATFPKGIQKDSGMDLRRFRNCWREMFGEAISESDEIARRNIAAICIDTGTRWYLPEALLSAEDRVRLLRFIDESFAAGRTAIYYDAIFQALESGMGNPLLTATQLKAYILATCRELYCCHDEYLTRDASTAVDLTQEIAAIMLAEGRAMRLEELMQRLPHLPADKLEEQLRRQDAFLSNGGNAYFCVSMADLDAQELQRISRLIAAAVDAQGYMLVSEFYQQLQERLPEMCERLSFLSMQGWRELIAKKLEYCISGPAIAPAGVYLSNGDLFARFCRDSGSFTLEQLQEFAARVDTPVPWEVVHDNCARVSREQFAPLDAPRFDRGQVDAILSQYCEGKYLPLSEVRRFDAFPYAGYPWTSYLLEHFVAKKSQLFVLMHAGYTRDGTPGVIARRDAGFRDYEDVLADALANSDVALEAEPAIAYLVRQNYISRRRYKMIDAVLSKARVLRMQRG